MMTKQETILVIDGVKEVLQGLVRSSSTTQAKHYYINQIIKLKEVQEYVKNMAVC